MDIYYLKNPDLNFVICNHIYFLLGGLFCEQEGLKLFQKPPLLHEFKENGLWYRMIKIMKYLCVFYNIYMYLLFSI